MLQATGRGGRGRFRCSKLDGGGGILFPGTRTKADELAAVAGRAAARNRTILPPRLGMH
jgi:hypothetical protein